MFIESILLGLPVPGVFLAKENDDGKFLIIDGQQRIKTLYFFFEGIFKEDEPISRDRKEFKLVGVREEFLGKTYKTLSEFDKNRLSDFPIHATIIKQESPDDGDTSIYHIFDRLNSKGRKLTPQEIRAAVAHGKLMDRISSLNDLPSWRGIFGQKNNRLKDQEMILIFFALHEDSEEYQAPMADFLNKFANKNRNPDEEWLDSLSQSFITTINCIYNSLGKGAFKLKSTINAAVFDSVMVTVANLPEDKKVDTEYMRSSYRNLINDKDYLSYISRATANESNLKNRFNKAREVFGI